MFDDEVDGELPREGSKHITVKRIAVQPDRYKPLPNSKTLEVVRFKRAIVEFLLTEDSTESTMRGILDFRGRIFTLSRRSGACNVKEVMEFFGDALREKYGKVVLEYLERGDEKTTWECSVANPNLFLGFLHYVKERGGLRWLIG